MNSPSDAWGSVTFDVPDRVFPGPGAIGPDRMPGDTTAKERRSIDAVRSTRRRLPTGPLRAMLPSSRGPSAGRRSPWRVPAFVTLAVVLGWSAWIVLVHPGRAETTNLLSGLPHDGIVAANIHGPETKGHWLVTSGTLMTHDGHLWSGVPDGGPPDPAAGRNGSSVLRAVSVATNFANVQVHVDLHVDSLVSTVRTPERAWDGIHLFLHYQDPNNLYSVDFQRRDGALCIKRKVTPGSDPSAENQPGDGVYKTLASTPLLPTPGWHAFDARIKDVPGGVVITLSMDGHRVLSAHDGESSALTGPGRVGLRGDNAEFTIRKFQVRKDR